VGPDSQPPVASKKTAQNGLKTARPEINLTRKGRRKAEVEGVETRFLWFFCYR
jgi:hypothetical protein